MQFATRSLNDAYRLPTMLVMVLVHYCVLQFGHLILVSESFTVAFICLLMNVVFAAVDHLPATHIDLLWHWNIPTRKLTEKMSEKLTLNVCFVSVIVSYYGAITFSVDLSIKLQFWDVFFLFMWFRGVSATNQKVLFISINSYFVNNAIVCLKWQI